MPKEGLIIRCLIINQNMSASPYYLLFVMQNKQSECKFECCLLTLCGYKYCHMSSDRMYRNAAATECLDFLFLSKHKCCSKKKICVYTCTFYNYFSYFLLLDLS